MTTVTLLCYILPDYCNCHIVNDYSHSTLPHSIRLYSHIVNDYSHSTLPHSIRLYSHIVNDYSHSTRARNNGRSTINDRQEIAFDRQRSKIVDHLDRQEPSSQKHG